MKTKIFTIAVLLGLLSTSYLFSQISGNQNYSGNYNSSIQSKANYSTTDSTLSIVIKVLLNQTADRYVLAIAVSQENESSKDCNSKINERINGFISKIYNLGIKDEDLYVDFIGQTKLYDYTVEDNKAEQYESGFEIKKNIIITTINLQNIDKIIEIASEFEIYDVIKVDYINDDIESIYNNLFDEAMKIVEKRKDNYVKTFNRKVTGNPRAFDNFYYVFPKSQYKQYKAYESSEVDNFSKKENYLKKIARKNTTFYYDGIDYSSFDKIINNAKPEIGIQYVLTLTVVYDIEKNK
ncbi:MAG: SIMPL domain-containing protein [Ignavibacteriales bacterium]|nr:SIMPL domain-containing protein [Ignavibacteriales bacterium]